MPYQQIHLVKWIDNLKKKKKDVKFSCHGGKLKVDQIHHFLHNSYHNNNDDHYDGYHLDKELSGSRFQAYYNPENDHLVTVHRGTQGVHDWMTDLSLGLFGRKKGKRFDHAKTQQNKAQEKYKTKNVSVLGHSLGSVLAEESGKTASEVITLNKPTTFYDYGKKPNKNQYDIKTNLDPVSILKPLEYKNGNEINIKSKTYNPLIEHKTEVLKRLNGEMEIGK